MSSYPPQILDAPQQYGFLPGLAKGAQGATNAYGEAMVKDVFAKKKSKRDQETYTKFQAAMQQDPNMEIDQTSMDENGQRRDTYKRKTSSSDVFAKDPVKAIKNAMLGFGTEGVGQAMGIQPQQSMYAQAAGAPPMSQYNTEGGELLDYPSTVKKELGSQFFPGFSPEQVNRDVMGMPAQTEQEKQAAKQKTYDPELTANVKANTTTPETMQELLDQRDDYEKAKVDVDSIFREYISKPQANPGIVQQIMSFFGGG